VLHRAGYPRSLTLLLFCTVALISCTVAGCGSSDNQIRANYSIDDVEAAGWTKSLQLPVDTVPHATDIWYGFYDGKDIEVRVYPSPHEAAEHGIEPAEEAVEGGKRSFGENRALLRLQYSEGKWTPGELSDMVGTMKTRYAAYLVESNLVMLCETDLGACQSLVGRLVQARE